MIQICISSMKEVLIDNNQQPQLLLRLLLRQQLVFEHYFLITPQNASYSGYSSLFPIFHFCPRQPHCQLPPSTYSTPRSVPGYNFDYTINIDGQHPGLPSHGESFFSSCFRGSSSFSASKMSLSNSSRKETCRLSCKRCNKYCLILSHLQVNAL